MLREIDQRKRERSGTISIAFIWGCLGVGLVLTGCTETRIRKNLDQARVDAYQEWLGQKEKKKVSEAFLKGNLSLEDAVKIGLKFNRDLDAVLADREVARGTVVQSWTNALPHVTLGGEYARRDSLGKPAKGFLDNYSVDLSVVQPVFKGGQIGAALRAGKLYSLFSDEQVRGSIQNVIASITTTYYSVLLNQHLYDVNRDAVLSAEGQLKNVRLKFQNQVASEYDVLRIEVDVANFKAEMIRAKNSVDLAKSNLLKLLGVNQESEVDLSDVLKYNPMKPVFDRAVEIAYKNRPDLYLGELNVRLQEEAVRVARSGYFPQVSAFFTRSWANPDPHQHGTEDNWGASWTAGGQAEWNLFDGFGREGKMIQEKATLKKRHVELLQAQDNALLEIKNSILSLKNAEELVESQKLNLKRATRGLELVEIGYREGVNTQVEVTDARAALTLAKGNFYRAVHDHSVTRTTLFQAMGVLGPWAGFKGEPTDSSFPKENADMFAPGFEKDAAYVPAQPKAGPVKAATENK